MSVAVLVPRLLSAAQDEYGLGRPGQAVDVVEALEVLEVAFVSLVVSAFNGAVSPVADVRTERALHFAVPLA